MKRIMSFTILSEKEIEDLVSAMIQSEAIMEVIKEDMVFGTLINKEIPLFNGETFRPSTDHLVDMLNEAMLNSKKVRKKL